MFALEEGLSIEGQPLNAYDTAVIDARSVANLTSTQRMAALVVRIVDFRPNVL
jgi:hypothetical protein